MKANSKTFCVLLFTVVAFVALSCVQLQAQCYLSSGCKPVDNLTYIPNGTGQVYHGDGSSNNGAGAWTINFADVNQCLSCHYGTDTLPYLWSGHKNMLRKIAPGVLWGGPDATSYSTTDDFYGSGSTYDWVNRQVTIGWCDPLATPVQNGLPINDEGCAYPFYTLPNAHAPAAYTPVAPTVAAGGVRNMFYIHGAWMSFGGSASPSSTQLNTIFDRGFTGENYPNGNFDCARCHTTGYNFDHWGPEPTSNSGNNVNWIPEAQLSRIPTDGYIAPGTSGTSSWYLSGIQCERCHVAAWGYGSHPNGYAATVVYNEGATALCMECHRQENVTMADSTQPGNISPSNPPQAQDAGYCSDLSGAAYSTCLVNPSNTWVYKPFIDHEQGQSFLNSPHARFSGNLIQNAQHTADLSITIAGTYSSQFSENPSDPTKNSGCTGCHDPHQSTVTSVPVAYAPKPMVNTCDKCHKLSQNILATINHPSGPGTPFPTGAASDIPGACVTCHMGAALGSPSSHLFRISADVNYRTFPTPDQLYTQGISALGTAPEYSPMNGTIFNPAIWLDVDLACGQCHVGGDGITNPYGLTMPPGMPGAHAYTKAQLAYWASVMHPGDPGVPAPTFLPQPGTYNTPQNVTISDSMSGATIYYTTDGSMPSTSSPVYSGAIKISATTTFRAMATHAGFPRSTVTLATYSIVLPTAPPPAFSPLPSLFSGPQSVKLSNTLSLPMYYTTDGSTPTSGSTPYSSPISVTMNTTIKAITAAYGYLTSPVSSGAYLIQAPTPTLSPGSGSYSGPVSVTIADTVVGVAINYTADGSTPTTSSTSCGNPCALTISTTTTLKAIASGGGFAASNVVVGTYTITAAAPTFSPGAGTYYAPVNVTMNDTTAGATIYYTTNGSFPSTSSPSCSSPCTVPISTTTTLRAMAVANGISQSSTSVAVYTIAANTPTFAPGSGSYSAPLSVTISDSSGGVTIYYTTNGAIPTTSSASCANPCTLVLPGSATVKSIAAGTGISQSAVGVATYTLH